ncbi:hypothetical protein [uncultured Corynebacterium sp.]|uniref:hypothetical protein n=1 Tax=uncultured Corynebacterium sp. TaxID=159447 RepID=UPI0025945986|nr:hypothetical protein [uncultured Corynebacterium sp.]
MRNEHERLARQWAEQVDPRYPVSALEEAARDYILATTTKPTMNDVEWDDEKHFLAGAVYEYDEHTCPVVMIGETQDSLGIYSVDLDENTGFWPSLEDLTPNGKRYKLVEVTDEPEHPETLTTVEDYKNTPQGTVVDICGTVAIRQRYGWFVTGYRYKLDNDAMFRLGEGAVVRWGE